MKRVIALILSIVIVITFSSCSLNFDKQEVNEHEMGEIVEETYYIYSPQFDSCYKALTTNQKRIYTTISKIAEEMPAGYTYICKKNSNSSKDISLAFTAFLNDHCEVFWLPNNYTTKQSNQKVYISFSKNEGYLAKSIKERDEMRRALNQKTDEIISQTTLMNEFEKEKFFYDYICDNTEYCLEGSSVHNSYGALIEGKALCEGYSRAFKLLCNKVGIENELILGQSEGEAHMWNCVNIEGKHSYCDITWDDREKGSKYLYFNITESQLITDHSIAPLVSKLTDQEFENGAPYNFFERICTYSNNGYYSKNDLGLGYDYINKCAKIVTAASKKQKKSVTVYLDTNGARQAFENDTEDFILAVQFKLNGIILKSYYLERDLLTLFF